MLKELIGFIISFRVNFTVDRE